MSNPCIERGCSACCHDTQMPLTNEDTARLAALGHSIAAFSRIDEHNERLLQNVGGACFFLKGGKCTVYNSRPAGCRIYPFVLAPGDTPERDVDCPWRSEFVERPGTTRNLLRIVGTIQRESQEDRSKDFPAAR